MCSEAIIVFLLFNLWSLDCRYIFAFLTFPGFPTCSCMEPRGKLQLTTAHCCAKLIFSEWKSRRSVAIQLHLYILCPNPGPPRQPNSQTSAGLSFLCLNKRSVKAFVPLDGNPSCKISKNMQINYFTTVGFPLPVPCCGYLRDQLAQRYSIVIWTIIWV